MIENSKPPVSNTGASNTKGVVGLIDWFSVTFPYQGLEGAKMVIEDVFKMKLADFVDSPKGLNGYQSQKRSGNIVLLFDGKPEMGVHVMLSGQGCRLYESLGLRGWRELSQYCVSYGAHSSRIDAALDDYKGFFTLDMIEEKIEKRELRTLFKKARPDKEIDLATDAGVDNGKTMYLGSKASDLRIRIYDKGKKEGVSYKWVRTEIELHDERATVFLNMLADKDESELGLLIAGVLRQYVNFVDPSDSDSNKARWPVCGWWAEFLGEVEKVRLTVSKSVKTIKDKMAWASVQWSKTMALVDVYLDEKGLDAYDWFGELMAAGRKKFKTGDYAVLQAAGIKIQ